MDDVDRDVKVTLAVSVETRKEDVMATPIESMLAQALQDYKKELNRGKLRGQSIGHRLRGAEEFALFLVGRTHKTERITGTLSK